MPPILYLSDIKTRFLIISDTHASPAVVPSSLPAMPVDVAIHCGDLTQDSKLSEFTSALALLKAINAPLKLVIPGHHDFTLDDAVYKAKITKTTTKLGIKLEEIYKVYGKVGQARQLLEETKEKDGIFLLDEGRHDFALANGASLSVYASPYTPSSPDDDDCLGQGQGKGKENWGFQYTKSDGHVFDIRYTPDVVITHGPPLGVLDDVTASSSSTKTSKTRFDNEESVMIETLAGLDNEESVVIESLAALRMGMWDSPEVLEEKSVNVKRLREERCCRISHCEGDTLWLKPRKHTLFVNAAIKPVDEEKRQFP
ncbi:hypothetical protein N0V85_003780, partial [Neurospora sp. IMI 360204]